MVIIIIIIIMVIIIIIIIIVVIMVINFSFIFYIIVRYYIEIQTRDEVEGSIQQCSLSLRRIIFISVWLLRCFRILL